MARLPRVYIEGVLYYVTSQSGHNESLFTNPADYQDYISLLANYKKQYGFKLFSYVLMPTHLHMLIELKNKVHISNIMHDINSLYTKNFNSRYNRTGHLFQERFKTLLAEKEPYLLRFIRHIHLSPKRAKIVEDPKDYPYSSHRQFLEPEERGYPEMREEIEEVFSVLKGREKALEEYVAKADTKELEDFRKAIHKKRILGSKAFADAIKKRIEKTVQEQKKAPFPQKKHMVYIVVSGIALLALGITVASFYQKQHASLMSTYDKTLAVYDSTLEMLKREKEMALKQDRDIEEYEWKIQLVEKALTDLQDEQKRAAEMQKKIEGYAWNIELRQIGGARTVFEEADTIRFENNSVVSAGLAKEGFSGSTYSKRELKNGDIVWDAMQSNAAGETASWHGKWDGKIMRGVLSRRTTEGVVRDFSFVSKEERSER